MHGGPAGPALGEDIYLHRSHAYLMSMPDLLEIFCLFVCFVSSSIDRARACASIYRTYSMADCSSNPRFNLNYI